MEQAEVSPCAWVIREQRSGWLLGCLDESFGSTSFSEREAMPEAVIVSTARSPIGRAYKGALREMRPDDLAAVTRLLGIRRLVTVTGPGGAGKTRLAIEAVRRVDVPVDGIWFVPLESVSHIDQVHDAVGSVLGALGSEAVTAVNDRLRDASLLLVVDNCEHLVDELGAVVRDLLEGAPGLRVLATSQRELGIPGEALVP